MKRQGVNTLVFLASAKVLTPRRFEFWVQLKVLGIKTLAPTKLVGVNTLAEARKTKVLTP